MSKNITPFLIVLAVIFLGIGGILYLSNQGPSNTNQDPFDLAPTLFPNTQNAPTVAPQASAIISQVPSQNQATSGASMDNFLTLPSGLKMLDLVLGNGSEVKAGDMVTVHYLGTLENGIKFDSSYDRNTPFTTQIGVGQVIKGWDEGILGMKTGGKRKLVVPASLGYGAQSVGSIPANSTLIFEVDLLSVK